MKVEVLGHLVLHIAGHQDSLPRHQLETHVVRLDAAARCCTPKGVEDAPRQATDEFERKDAFLLSSFIIASGLFSLVCTESVSRLLHLDDDDDEEDEEEEDWLVTDDPGSKVADQQQKAEAEAFDKLNREAQESREIHQAAKKAAADGDEEALAEAVANFEEESKMVAAVVEARGAAEKAAQELKEKIQKETKAKSEESEKAEQAPIRFKDAVGRHFAFPFRLCATWQDMEDLIKQSFPQVEVVGPHVMEGRYDLIGPDGEIILPSVWEKVVQPDWAITMRMWPGYEMPLSRTRWTHQPVKSPAPAPGKEDPEKIRLEAELTTFKAMEEEQKAAEKQKEVEAQIRKEAEEAFWLRMEAMRIAQEEAKEEIEKAKIDAIRAARERMEAERKAEDEARARLKEKPQWMDEAKMRAAVEKSKEEEEEAFKRFEELARLDFENVMQEENQA
ncbi:hypothetical protein FALCPG4_016517 [Fusarium falciforme]